MFQEILYFPSQNFVLWKKKHLLRISTFLLNSIICVEPAKVFQNSAKVVLGAFHLLWEVVHMPITQLSCCEFMIVFNDLTWSQIWDMAKGEGERESHLHKWVECVNQWMGFLKLPFTHFLILILRFLIEHNLKMKIVSKWGKILNAIEKISKKALKYWNCML